MTDTMAPEAPSTETLIPETPAETPSLHELINEARLVVAQDPMSPLAMFVLAWDQQIGASLSRAKEIAETLKPQGGPSAAEVRKLIAESIDEEVIKRREVLAKLDEQRKALLSQMHTLVGAGTPEVSGEEKDALKAEYKTHRDLVAKAVPSLETMFTFQNSAEGLALVAALGASLPSLTGASSGATGVRRQRFESVTVVNHPEGPKDFGTFSKLLMQKGVKEADVTALYALYDAAGDDHTFTLSNGWVVKATPKSEA